MNGGALIRPRSFWPALMVGLALLAGSLLQTAVAYAAPADRSGVVATAQEADPVGVAGDPGAALGPGGRPRGPLPFARPDLAILVLGVTIVIAAGAGAPLLFRPLRLVPSSTVRAIPEPTLAREQGGVAHAPA